MAVFMEAIEEAHSLDRHGVRERAAEEFDTDRIVDCVVQALGASLQPLSWLNRVFSAILVTMPEVARILSQIESGGESICVELLSRV